MKKIDVSKIIVVDLRSKHGKRLSNARLTWIADCLDVDSEWLIDFSQKVVRYCFCSETNTIIMVNRGYGNSWVDYISDEDMKSVKKIVPMQFPKTPQKNKKVKTPKVVEIVLDVDTILDKIIDFGIDKLTKEELAFLDSQKYSS